MNILVKVALERAEMSSLYSSIWDIRKDLSSVMISARLWFKN